MMFDVVSMEEAYVLIFVLSLYRGQTTAVKIDNNLSKQDKIKIGVNQGYLFFHWFYLTCTLRRWDCSN